MHHTGYPLRDATPRDILQVMKRASFTDMNCSIAQSLEIVGEWWTLLIIRDAFFGITRFEDFQRRLGIARNILTTRLDTLVEQGILERRTYDEARGRHDYLLTKMGRALWPVMVTLRQWGDRWVIGRGHEPVKLLHTTCGSATTADLVCHDCGETLSLRDVRAAPGPGLTDDDLLPAKRP
jgi:DNA-binding HxlR family transcriptional regulator